MQDNAESAVRHMLKKACLKASSYEQEICYPSCRTSNSESSTENIQSYSTEISPISASLAPSISVLEAVDYMDDGTPIHLQVTIDANSGSAHFDFTGTGPEVVGNTNAPRAVLLSCLIYSLRCLIGGDICLNQGCLKPISVSIPIQI